MPSACFEQVVATNCWGLPSFDGLSHRSSCDKLTTGLGCPKGTLNGEGVMANILGEAMPIKPRFGLLKIWMPTMLPHGVKAVPRI